ncbi:MAG: glycogen synthase, partial [Anaerolineaceae bacterium]|nr:glycogen synthase [Anaerolineaceae bacterium]
ESDVYSNDNFKDGLKFIFFSLATLELARKLDWSPNIIHANDWHTAITAFQLNRLRSSDLFFKNTKSVITIHNLPFMGSGTDKALDEFGIPPSDTEQLPTWARKLPLPMGLAAADQLVTVSPTYAKEILTPEFGSGLEDFLSTQKNKLCGIINGLEESLWNPEDDADISMNFSTQNLSPRRENKLALIDEFSLNPDPEIPLLIFIGRMSRQKGVDIALNALQMIKNEPWQAIFLGTGDIDLENLTLKMQDRFPEHFRAIIKFDALLAKRMYAGADILLMPSRYEPCGLAQMIAMLYGCVPVASSTGGLRDTIKNTLDDFMGSGFLFKDLSTKGLAESIQHAFSFFGKKDKWVDIQINGMNNDFSWRKSALEYAKIYQRLLR